MDVQTRADNGDTAAQLELARGYEREDKADLARGWYARAAQGGDAGALRCLAASLLTQPPMAPRDGVEMMREAAQRGDGDAALICAVIAAQDTALQDRWDVAWQYQQMAAANGSAPAQAAGALLPRSGLAVPPSAHLMFDTPRIEVCPGFASQQECRWLMDRATPQLKAAQLYDPVSGGGFRGETIRNNSDASFDLVHSDLVIALLRSRIAAWTGLDIQAMEPPMGCATRKASIFRRIATRWIPAFRPWQSRSAARASVWPRC